VTGFADALAAVGRNPKDLDGRAGDRAVGLHAAGCRGHQSAQSDLALGDNVEPRGLAAAMNL